MRITKVDFYGVSDGKFIRYAVIVIDNAIVIRGVKLVRRPDNSILIAMPQRKKINDVYEDIVHPHNAAARQVIEQAVLSAWAAYPIVTTQK